jgi:hypothetical protein
MALPSSGPLSLSDIQTEFGGTNPISLNEYYAGGGLVPAGTSGTYGAVPTSGQISVQNFYGTTNYTPIYVEEVFSTWLYTGNASTNIIVNNINLSANGGLVWMKARSGVYGSGLPTWIDTARGINKQLYSNLAAAQYSYNNTLTAFNSNGFTLGPDTETEAINAPNAVMASWTFRKKSKFFDIVTFTGNGTSNRAISHSLDSTPGMVIVKALNSASINDWITVHRGQPNKGWLRLNQDATVADAGTDIITFNASTFTVGPTGSPEYGNQNGIQYVAYLFAHNAGGFGPTGTDNIITCGSYVGNNSTSTTVTLGYEPQWVMVKRATGTSSAYTGWAMFDISRGMPALIQDNTLLANTNNPENPATANGAFISPLPTGFRLDEPGSNLTNTDSTFIYVAIRRGPMRVPTVGTSVFVAGGYDSNSTSQTINETVTSPDLGLGIGRTGPTSGTNGWYDRLRGQERALRSWTSNAQYSSAPGGEGRMTNTMFGMLVEYTYGLLNSSPTSYVMYYMKRAPQFFDTIYYAGTGSAQNLSHNLTIAPELVIIKATGNGGGGFGWVTGSSYYPSWGRYIQLNTDEAVNGSNNAGPFNNTAPTSSVLTVNTWTETNGSGSNYVAYLFATCPGVSKVGSYTGTGALQTVNCGFTTGARFVLIKRIDGVGDWYVYDTTRGMSSGNDPYLLLNRYDAQVTGTNYVDTTSVGFQVTAAAPAALNASGGTYLFLAIA